MTVGNVLNVDAPGIMNIEDAKSELQSEREAYVTYFVKKKETACTAGTKSNQQMRVTLEIIFLSRYG